MHYINARQMKQINLSTIIILGVSVFCISETHMEMACTIQKIWTVSCILLILIIYPLYSFLIRPISVPIERTNKSICIIGFLEIVYSVVQLFGFLPNNYKYAYFSGSLNNPAVFGMLLSFCITISTYLSFQARKGNYSWQILSIIFAIFIVLSDSRTAIIASLCGVTIVIAMKKHNSVVRLLKNRHLLSITAVCLFIILFTLYFHKRGSADGRLLIWNVCLDMIKEKPLLGWGIDGYTAQYMNYQADYLHSHPTSPFAMLAGETQNSFNEFLHIALVGGIPSAFIFLGILLGTMWYILRKKMNHYIVLFSIVVVFVIWCFFSYPLNIPFVWFLLLYVGLSIMPTAVKTPSSRIICLSVIGVSFYGFSRLIIKETNDIQRVYLQEFLSKENGYLVLEKYGNAYNKFSNNGLFLYNYAALLHLYGEYEKSITIFKECSEYVNDYNMMLIMGDDYQQLDIPDSALTCYRRASEMVPNRFLPLYYQMVVYQEQGEYEHARDMAKNILNKENKIEKSKIIKEIIRRANKCLETSY